MIKLCPPALIYLVFSLTHILIDTFKGFYNSAFFKFIVMIMVTLLLNILCEQGLTLVSWLIVFIPFVMMTVIVSLLLYIFGLKETTGTVDYSCDASGNKICDKDVSGNIVIYNPQYNPSQTPVYYVHPNIIVPAPQIQTPEDINNYNTLPPTRTTWSSSSPEFQTHDIL